jgi:hypothetical protein
MPGESASEFFPVLQAEVIDYDTAQVELSLDGDFDGIQGISFQWGFANPSPAKYVKGLKAIESILIGYFLVHVLSRGDGVHTFHEALGIVLGVAGIVASNPFGLLFSTPPGRIDHFLMAVYLGVFRMCCFFQIEFVRNRKPSTNLFFALLVVGFFVHYVVADFDFFGEFRKSQTEMELEIENSLDMKLLLTHCGYFGVAALWIALACFRGKSCGGQRLAASGFFVFCDFCATGFSQVWAVRTGKFAGTVFPEMAVPDAFG